MFLPNLTHYRKRHFQSYKCQSGSDSSGFDQVPIDSNNSLVLQALQRFRKNQIARTFLFFKSNDTEFAAGIAFLNRHHAVVFDLRLQMSILPRFLPERVNLRLTGFLDDLRKTRSFDFEQFHKKSARELRQGGSNYRCCIPALAGFVSPQSIAPDGGETYRKACPEQCRMDRIVQRSFIIAP